MHHAPAPGPGRVILALGATAAGRSGHIRGLMVALGAEDEFAAYLAAVRATHGRKRNFTSMLAAMAW
jgi:hypothetical protein